MTEIMLTSAGTWLRLKDNQDVTPTGPKITKLLPSGTVRRDAGQVLMRASQQDAAPFCSSLLHSWVHQQAGGPVWVLGLSTTEPASSWECSSTCSESMGVDTFKVCIRSEGQRSSVHVKRTFNGSLVH